MSSQDPATPAEAARPASYEFSPEENVLLRSLASRMQFVGVFFLGIGVAIGIVVASRLSAASSRDLGPLVYALLNILIGLWTARAGGEFRRVADTQGQDIRHLLLALQELRKLYTFQYWLCLIVLVTTLVLMATSYVY